MPRYIDADALLKLPHDVVEDSPWTGCKYGYSDETIKEQTTLSPDEVRGVGKWEKDSDGLDVCSECGEIALQRVFIKLPDKIVDLQMVRSKFCPNCGARMGGVQDALP